MSKAHDSHACTCPSGDGSLRWPCPVHQALLPCPFCGASAAVQNESPADNSGGYFVECKSCGASTNLRYACGDDPVPLLVEQWNARAPQAEEAQAAPVAPDANRLRAEILEHASKASRLVRTLFNEPTGTLSDVEVGDWIQRAQQYLSLATPALPATEDSSAGDLAEVQTEPVPNLIPSAIAAAVCQRVAELDDRSSPADWPEAMLVTQDELHTILIEELATLSTPQAQPADALTQAALDVLTERRRQVEAEGWTAERDDQYVHGDMASAAGCYAMFTQAYPKGDPHHSWPWDKAWWKPSKDARRNRVKACALLLAEIERLDRAAMAAAQAQTADAVGAKRHS